MPATSPRASGRPPQDRTDTVDSQRPNSAILALVHAARLLFGRFSERRQATDDFPSMRGLGALHKHLCQTAQSLLARSRWQNFGGGIPLPPCTLHRIELPIRTWRRAGNQTGRLSARSHIEPYTERKDTRGNFIYQHKNRQQTHTFERKARSLSHFPAAGLRKGLCKHGVLPSQRYGALTF